MAVSNATTLLIQAGRISPPLIAAARLVDQEIHALRDEVERLRWALTSASVEHERQMEQALRERDEAQEWADRLAYAIAPQSVIGEHSSLNNPWQNALDVPQN